MDGLNPITRREVFLAAASGDQVETPEPITREEMYLKKIAEGGGGSDLPDTPAEDGTYSLQNTVSSGTGTLSWASGGSSGGGVLVATIVYDNGTIKTDKTWQEIHDAPLAVIKDPDKYFSNGKTLLFADYVSGNSRDGYSVIAYSLTGDSYDLWSETADGYPALVDNGGE